VSNSTKGLAGDFVSPTGRGAILAPVEAQAVTLEMKHASIKFDRFDATTLVPRRPLRLTKRAMMLPEQGEKWRRITDDDPRREPWTELHYVETLVLYVDEHAIVWRSFEHRYRGRHYCGSCLDHEMACFIASFGDDISDYFVR
jgi:hypothetical protein